MATRLLPLRTVPLPAYGTWSKRVCWFVQPTKFDYYLPEDHTLVYEIREAYQGMGRTPPLIMNTLCREHAAEVSRELYAKGYPHSIMTSWRDPNGHYVKKMPIVRRWKEENEGQSQGDKHPVLQHQQA